MNSTKNEEYIAFVKKTDQQWSKKEVVDILYDEMDCYDLSNETIDKIWKYIIEDADRKEICGGDTFHITEVWGEEYNLEDELRERLEAAVEEILTECSDCKCKFDDDEETLCSECRREREKEEEERKEAEAEEERLRLQKEEEEKKKEEVVATTEAEKTYEEEYPETFKVLKQQGYKIVKLPDGNFMIEPPNKH